MPRVAFVVLIAAMVAGSVTTSHAQLPTKFVNLQVLPKDTPPGVLVGTMKNFTRYLGVRCAWTRLSRFDPTDFGGAKARALQSAGLKPAPSVGRG